MVKIVKSVAIFHPGDQWLVIQSKRGQNRGLQSSTQSGWTWLLPFSKFFSQAGRYYGDNSPPTSHKFIWISVITTRLIDLFDAHFCAIISFIGVVNGFVQKIEIFQHSTRACHGPKSPRSNPPSRNSETKKYTVWCDILDTIYFSIKYLSFDIIIFIFNNFLIFNNDFSISERYWSRSWYEYLNYKTT